MGKNKLARCGIIHAAPAIALAGLVAACASGPPSPAPVVLGGTAPRVVAEPRGVPVGGALPRGDTRRVVVAQGQSLSVLAHAYRVPASVIIAANHLTPPYKIETGKQLLIPGSANAPTPTGTAAASPAGKISCSGCSGVGMSPRAICKSNW